MKTKILALAFIAITQLGFAQKLISKTGHVWFYSHTAVEDIEAHNKASVSILDPATGDIQISILIKSFEFKVALMQEHFNENYMESTKFPKASFKGKITNLDKIDFKKDGTYPAEVSGDLTIHGVTQPINTTGSIEILNGVVTGKAKFTIAPKNFGIVIPALVESKIAKEVEVTVELPYTN